MTIVFSDASKDLTRPEDLRETAALLRTARLYDMPLRPDSVPQPEHRATR